MYPWDSFSIHKHQKEIFHDINVWHIYVDNVSIKQQQREFLKGTKEQFMKEKSIIVDNVSLKQHQKEVLQNTEEQFIKRRFSTT